jgi:uncharacterized repeat protein (TIGR04138 family)
MAIDLETTLLDLAQKHGRYRPNAYKFVMDAVQFTVNRLTEKRHVTGPELLRGIRDLALQAFGPMAKTVFEQWGIRSTEDFGTIVFQLVDAGLLGKTDADKPSDFARGYDFNEAFVRNFDWLDRIAGDLPRES